MKIVIKIIIILSITIVAISSLYLTYNISKPIIREVNVSGEVHICKDPTFITFYNNKSIYTARVVNTRLR
ncbi:hypothetical protein Calag_0677 [Caldisphaera lagunensis DSM 15908]|uniref:Uncharacterized protein n=1 Tax=Caldisphaera lagunensis (strain DSM 15908 / JCM 11604 / ANMR 0165 / IC-154) TaxID=1056495 RepID=L0A976_CALLD|nr:hypothetical protein [Caldisphaera lagunensis]AFZ70426.1 hypothetical protein Calag_0677 [Caldisphaera lagunensis DSM 15908]